MKIITIFFVFFISQTAFALDNRLIVENSIGKLLLLHDIKYSYQEDLNPFGSAEVYREFLKIYDEKIKSLPKSYRIDYFWASMWHLEFDGHYMLEFQKLIIQDCGNEFIERLQIYINIEKKLKRSKARLYLSEKVLSGLKIISNNIIQVNKNRR